MNIWVFSCLLNSMFLESRVGVHFSLSPCQTTLWFWSESSVNTFECMPLVLVLLPGNWSPAHQNKHSQILNFFLIQMDCNSASCSCPPVQCHQTGGSPSTWPTSPSSRPWGRCENKSSGIVICMQEVVPGA